MAANIQKLTILLQVDALMELCSRSSSDLICAVLLLYCQSFGQERAHKEGP